MKKWISITIVCFLIAAVVYYLYPEGTLPPGTTIQKIVVFKSRQIMQVYSHDQVVKIYSISIGQNGTGDKQVEGDKRTPEGNYVINAKNTQSDYHKNLGISYPNKNDISEAKKRNLKPGGDIKIHGLRNGLGFIGRFHRLKNWTAGGTALTNEEVDELYDHTSIGTPIVILP